MIDCRTVTFGCHLLSLATCRRGWDHGRGLDATNPAIYLAVLLLCCTFIMSCTNNTSWQGQAYKKTFLIETFGGIYANTKRKSFIQAAKEYSLETLCTGPIKDVLPFLFLTQIAINVRGRTCGPGPAQGFFLFPCHCSYNALIKSDWIKTESKSKLGHCSGLKDGCVDFAICTS